MCIQYRDCENFNNGDLIVKFSETKKRKIKFG